VDLGQGCCWFMPTGLRAVSPLAARRHLAAHPHRLAGPGRRRGRDHLAGQRRCHGDQGASARRGRAQTGDLQRQPPGGVAVEPADHALGRSRGGLTSKLHLTVEGGQRPLSVVVTAGQRGDSPQFAAVLGGIRVPRLGRGRPRTRPDRVLADKAYSSRANRALLRRLGIRATIPQKDDQAAHRRRKGCKGGRPPAFDRVAYRLRHAVECGINLAPAPHGLCLPTGGCNSPFGLTVAIARNARIASIPRRLDAPVLRDPGPNPDAHQLVNNTICEAAIRVGMGRHEWTATLLLRRATAELRLRGDTGLDSVPARCPTCRQPYGLLPTSRWVTKDGPHLGRAGRHRRHARASSFSPAVPPTCHKERTRAVSSGQSRSL
jgi:hypothetical protein